MDRRVLTLAALSLAVFTVLLNVTVVNVNLPDIQRSLHTDVAGLEWVVNAYTLPLATLLLAAGSLGDRYGRKRIFLLSLVVFSLGSGLCSVARSLDVLLAGRALQGIGAAAVLPGSLAIISVVYPNPRQRATAIGIWGGANGLALATGPLIGGLLGDRFGWESVFLLNVPVGLLAVVAGWLLIREAEGRGPRSALDPPAQVLTILWIAALTFALIQGNSWGWSSPRILLALALALVGFAVFLAVESRTSQPMVPLGFFRSPTFSAANTVGFAIFFALQAAIFFLSLFLQEVQGDSPVEAGLRLTPLTGAFMLISPLAGSIAGRLGSRVPMVIGLLLTTAGLFLLSSLTPHTPYSTAWWRMAILGIGFALTLAPMTAAILASVPPARAGTGSAIHTAARQVGGLLGIAALGAIAGSQGAMSPTHGPPGSAAAIFAQGMDVALFTAGLVTLAAAAVALAFVRAGEAQRRPVQQAAGS
jgi:DHA2 family methylenomycin A resistance protein-like MFS transporter